MAIDKPAQADEIEITDAMVSAAEEIAFEALSSPETSGFLSEGTIRLMLEAAMKAGGEVPNG